MRSDNGSTRKGAMGCKGPGALLAGAVLLAGCVGADPGESVTTVRAEDVPAHGQPRLTVDLRDPARAYLFDKTDGHIDFHQVELVCPNGVSMEMYRWLLSESAREGVDVTGGPFGVFAVGIDPALVEGILGGADDDKEEDCIECHQCPDGAFLCTDLCGHDDSTWHPPRTGDGTLLTGGEPPTPTPYDPRDPPPDDESSGSGSDDGPGPSGSISSGTSTPPSSGSSGGSSGGSGSSGGPPTSPSR